MSFESGAMIDTPGIVRPEDMKGEYDPQLEQALEALALVAHQPTTIQDGEFVRNPSATLLEQKDCKERIVAAGYDLNAAIKKLVDDFEQWRLEYVDGLPYTE